MGFFDFMYKKDITAYDQEILDTFSKLGIYEIKCISKIISENEKKYNILSDEYFPEIDILRLSYVIYNEIKEEENNILVMKLDTEYYEELIKEYLNDEKKELEKTVIDIQEGAYGAKKVLFDTNFSKILLSINKVVEANLYDICLAKDGDEKIYKGISTDAKEEDYSIQQIKEFYNYFTDSLVGAISVAIVLYYSIKVQNIDKDSELYRLISNMISATADIKVVSERSYKIYKNSYYTEFGDVHNENFYNIALNILKEKIEGKVTAEEKKLLGGETELEEFDFDKVQVNLRTWIYGLAKNKKRINIAKLIVLKMREYKIEDVDDLTNMIKKLDYWENYYYDRVERNAIDEEKEKYLKGDFSDLKKAAKERLSYKNITTGTEFEKYLVNLFSELGYKTKHTGKAGDQGCDLIAEKNKIKYCIQAKFYNEQLSNTPVQEIIGALKFYKGDRGVVVTNSSFTLGAVELAKANNVILIDGEKLQNIIEYLYNENNKEIDIFEEMI